MGRQREIRHALARAAHEAGALVEFQRTGTGHQRVILTYQNRSGVVTISSTPGKTYAIDAMIADVRRTLRELGYTKPPKASKVEKPWRPQVVTRSEPYSAPALRYRPRYRDEINGMTAPLRQLLPGYPWKRKAS